MSHHVGDSRTRKAVSREAQGTGFVGGNESRGVSDENKCGMTVVVGAPRLSARCHEGVSHEQFRNAERTGRAARQHHGLQSLRIFATSHEEQESGVDRKEAGHVQESSLA